MGTHLSELKLFSSELNTLSSEKLLLTTLNAHSFNLIQTNAIFKEALVCSNVILPDGISIVWAKQFLSGTKLKKIAGADLFAWEMQRLNDIKGTCFFLGSTENTLRAIQGRAAKDFPGVKVYTLSPPFTNAFTLAENAEMIEVINHVKPDVLFVGMTAPKQEIWAYANKEKIMATHICCVGAVFDFYAGTVKRAPQWMIKLGLEWLYRLLKEPGRLWKRYLIGNLKFIFLILKEKFSKS